MARNLKNWLTTYLEYTDWQEAPKIVHFWTGVGTLAAVLKKRVFIDQIGFKWIPNFYIIFVAKPGLLTKSTSMGIGESLLVDLPDVVRFGPNTMTWQALITDMAGSEEHVEFPDGTIVPMTCRTFFSSELGSLLDIEDRKLMDILTDLWDGRDRPFKKTTKSDPDEVVHGPWLNILAATTPSWLADNMPKAVVTGGFTSRCIFIFGDKKRKLVAYPDEEVDLETHKALREDLLHDLNEIAMMKGKYRISDAARKFGRDWYEKHWNAPSHELFEDRYAGYLSRKQAMIHKLAIVLAAAHSSELLIQKEDVVGAVALVDEFEKDLPRVFSSIHASPFMEKASEIVRMVQRMKKITRKQLYNRFFLSMDREEFSRSIQSAVEAGMITETEKGGVICLEAVDSSDKPR